MFAASGADRRLQQDIGEQALERAALKLIDEEGFEALRTRRLAKRLGVEGPSLYNHIRSRDDLLDEIRAVMLEEQAFARHPHVIASIARRPLTTEAPLRLYNELFAFLEAHGFDVKTATAISGAIEFLVLGSAIETYAEGFDRPPCEYAADYPHLANALANGEPETVDERGFEPGLQAMLNHFASLRRA